MKKITGTLVAWLAALSSAAIADVTITRVANEGVIVDDGVAKIMIDGLVVEPYALYGGLPPGLEQQFRQAAGPFEGVDLALATHRHHDHNQPEFACIFLKRSSATRMSAAPQVFDLMRERCRELVTTSPRIRVIDPQYDAPEALEADGARISAIRLSHGVGKFAKIQNYGYLVDIGGLRMLHIGDAAMQPDDFARAGLDGVELDVAFIPFWFFQPGPGEAVIERFMDAEHKLAVHIPPKEMAEVREYLAENFPDVQVLAAPGDSVVIYPRPIPGPVPAPN